MEVIMTKKRIGLVLSIGGVVLTMLSVFADYIRLGSYPGINWAQIVGIAVGLVAVAVGLWLMYSKGKAS
jgi:hypothetical protein